MTTIRCPHCGTTNRAGSNYCNQCGAELRTDEAAPRPPSDVEPAPVATPAVDSLLDQPWLRPEEEPTEAVPAGEEPDTSPAAKRLLANVQGLIEPVRVFSEAADETALSPTAQPVTPLVDLNAEQLRRLRSLMAEEPALLESPPPLLATRLPALRLPWVFALLGVALLLPLLLRWQSPSSEAYPWPGVAEAHDAVEALPPGATVVVLWGYDPATAGELDLLALPLVVHLLDRQIQPVVVSLLPNGPATARRLFARAAAQRPAVSAAQATGPMAPAVFLPGGIVALPLLGQDRQTGLNAQPGVATAALVQAAEQPPALAVILAAQAEDVQQWLEQAQPLDQVPAIAFTSAVADPIVRPYFDSGQLRGLVSGFDGAQVYQQLLQRPLADDSRLQFQQQLVLQNWGHVALILIIILGNLAALFSRHPA
jgi:hypothetical protein